MNELVVYKRDCFAIYINSHDETSLSEHRVGFLPLLRDSYSWSSLAACSFPRKSLSRAKRLHIRRVLANIFRRVSLIFRHQATSSAVVSFQLVVFIFFSLSVCNVSSFVLSDFPLDRPCESS